MKRLFLVSAALTFGQFSGQAATPTLVSFIAAFGTCASVGNSPAAIMWNGSKFVCATLGPGVTLSAANVLTVPAAIPVTPQWQIETVGFNNLAQGATTLTYSTLKTPVAGVILYYYSSANLFANSYGAVAFTGQPLTIAVPTGWLPTDSVTFIYASQ